MMKKHLLSFVALLLCTQLVMAQSPVRIACVGNSITYGAGISNRDHDSYPAVLGRLLGDGYDVRNFGISARTLLNKGDHPYMKEQIYRDALAFQPNIVTIKLGTNDTKPWNWAYGDEFADDLRTLVRSFLDLDTHPTVFLCYPVPAERLDWGINDSTVVAGVIPAIRRVADEFGLSIVDLHTVFEPYRHLQPDHVHPNADGAALIAHVLCDAILSHLQQHPVGVVVQPSYYQSAAERRLRRPENFKGITSHKPAEWFGTPESRAVADTVLAYQFPSGGWCKNHNWNLPPDERMARERADMRLSMTGKGIGPTIDNGATTTEIRYLTRMFAACDDDHYRQGALDGIRYLLRMQYPNGGWPQFWPSRYDEESYSDFITFNDDAMVHVMRLLRDVADNRAPYDALHTDAALRRQADKAFEKGIDCILRCQIVKDGQLTVWCAQHNPRTLAPEHARAYELASFCGGGETVGILDLLMDLPHPSKKVRRSVAAAIAWLESHALVDTAIEHFRAEDGRFDTRMVSKPGAPALWARFYDLDTEQPIYCDRDGQPRSRLEDIGYERRNGYAWVSGGPAAVIARYHNDWNKQ